MTDIPRSQLPEMPDARYFSNPVYAWVADTLWNDDEIPTITEAVQVLADKLTPDELATTAVLMDELNMYRVERGQPINTFVRRMLAQEVDLLPVQVVDGTRNALKEDFCGAIAMHFIRYELEYVAEQEGDLALEHTSYAEAIRKELTRRVKIAELIQQNKDQQALAFISRPPSGLSIVS